MSVNKPRELDYLDVNSLPKGIQIRTVRQEDVNVLYQLAVRHFGNEIASFDVVERILQHHPESAYAIGRYDKTKKFKPLGYVALLMLNQEGVKRLKMGEFNAADPDLAHLSLPGEQPAGIYVWGVVAPGKAIAGLPKIMEILKRKPYCHADVYARPASVSGLHLMQALCFERIFDGARGEKPLYRYRRLINRKASLFVV
ncbi:hypothetical protein [Rhodoligotrophos defluvii]|uniref:hypothetical protein n=1 Tax=Rhodoligotrophos defluvii TaxID=2561934 RepID=UPI0010C9D0C7|nr:hypothetical protein [Rhodoligotrophos defluvii]